MSVLAASLAKNGSPALTAATIASAGLRSDGSVTATGSCSSSESNRSRAASRTHETRSASAASLGSGNRSKLMLTMSASRAAGPSGRGPTAPIITGGWGRCTVRAAIGAKWEEWRPLRSRWPDHNTRSYPSSPARRTAAHSRPRSGAPTTTPNRIRLLVATVVQTRGLERDRRPRG
jgi:hypothetical protein